MFVRLAFLCWFGALPHLVAADTGSEPDPCVLADAVRPSCVQVEITLRYDKGEPPEAAGWGERCPNCGNYHGSYGAEDLVKEQRPQRAAGYLLSPTRVITTDSQIHPRFVEKIAIRFGAQLVDAKPAAYFRHENAVLLELAKPLSGATPLHFDSAAEGPYFAVNYRLADATWGTYVEPLGGKTVIADTGEQVRAATPASVIVNRDGVAVGMDMNGELALDETWKGSPLDWPALSASEMRVLLSRIETIAARGLPHVTLRFRSPKKDQANPWSYGYGETEPTTELHTCALLLDETTLLVLANLKSNTTARLEQIQVRFPKDEVRTATFGHSLRDFGCFTATLDEPVDGALAIDTRDLRTLRNELAIAVTYSIYGEDHVLRFLHTRVPSFELGRKSRVYPRVPQDEADLFVFRQDGSLVAGPLAVRLAQQDRWESNNAGLTPVAYVTELLGDLAANVDVSNIPLTEAEENRIAWLGVEMQNLDPELARANNVSELTQDGATGVLVSYVYRDSPAARAGIEPGCILLRLYLEDRPEPIAVRAEEQHMPTFPWERLGEVPEEYFDEIPQPWPPIENDLTRLLTNAGFGKKFRAEFFIDGETVSKEFEIVESPPHYDSAKRFKSDALGLTVRDLSFEVRRYFQKAEDEPGVIVSKVEPGSKASVGGIKPYEIITHANGEPIVDVGEFERLTGESGPELRLSIKRMTQGRIVKIKMPERDEGE